MTDQPTFAEKAKAELRAFDSRVSTDASAIAKRIEAAIEHWYDAHFHRASIAGSAPISAADKAELHAAVSAAVTSPKE